MVGDGRWWMALTFLVHSCRVSNKVSLTQAPNATNTRCSHGFPTGVKPKLTAHQKGKMALR